MTRDEYYEILVALKITESKNDKCNILSNVIFSTRDNDDNGLIE
jgi:hypothetical protein